MSNWTWPAVVLIGILVAGIATLFAVAPDQATRDHILGYFDTLVAFVIGTVTGATAGSTIGFLRGRKYALNELREKSRSAG